MVPNLGKRDLDRLAGLSEGHVWMIESGNRPRLEMPTATALTRVLGISLDWLVNGVGPKPKAKDVIAAVERAREGKAA